MKTFAWQVLVLGGFYFIISFLLSWKETAVFEALNMAIFVIFIIMLVVLCFKRKYNFLTRFQNKFIKMANYLSGLGVAQYFGIIFITIPGIIYGYNVSKAQFNGLEIPVVPVAYLQLVNYCYWGILLLSLIWATYQSFGKK